MKSLYHGTIHDFSVIDVNEGKGYKDFGKGFYATANKAHAENLAKRNRALAEAKNKAISNRTGERFNRPTAYRYNLIFDESCLTSGELNVKIFKTADIEWIKFILMNRRSNVNRHNYDIVIGPTADENTSTIINSYLDELERTHYSETTLNKLIKDLGTDKLPKQYFFATNKATAKLKFDRIRREIVE